MLGVLVKGDLDDGRGKARVNLFRHKHEIETGRTSSVGMEIMGFDTVGQVVTSDIPGREYWMVDASDGSSPNNHLQENSRGKRSGSEAPRLSLSPIWQATRGISELRFSDYFRAALIIVCLWLQPTTGSSE